MNNKMKSLVFLMLIILTSCAVRPKRKESSYNTVNVLEDKSTVKIDKENQLIASSYGYGPKKDSDISEQVESTKRDPVVVIHLAPAGYHMAGYISLLRSMEQQNIKIAAISAEGLSTIVAALYAKYNDSNRVEWKLYSLLGRLKKTTLYSSNWKEQIKIFLREEFKGKREHQLKSLLLIPLMTNEKVIITKEEIIDKVIMSSLNITSSRDLSNKLSTLLSSEVDFRHRLTKQASADIVFQIAILPENFVFKGISGYQYGIYTKKVYQLAKKSKVFFQLDYLANPIDEIPNIGEAIARTKKSSDNIAKVMLKKIKAWKTKNNKSKL